MFTAFISKFKADPAANLILDQSNEALKERVAHMFWTPGIDQTARILEMKRAPVVKPSVSIRRAIAA